MRTVIVGFVVVVMNVWVLTLMVFEFLAGLLVFVPCVVLLKLLGHWPAGKTMRLLIWAYSRIWLFIVSPFVWVRRENMGSQNFPRPGIIVVNHLSVLDAYFMGVLPLFDATFIVRDWPFRLWWYTPFMRLAGYMNVERLPWNTLEQRVGDITREGRRVLMFPEGHRSRDGALVRLRTGAFKLARANGVPIIPLCIAGTDQLMPPGHFWVSPAKVRIRCLGPVYPEPFTGELGHVAMRKHVQDLMRSALEEMRQELGEA